MATTRGARSTAPVASRPCFQASPDFSSRVSCPLFGSPMVLLPRSVIYDTDPLRATLESLVDRHAAACCTNRLAIPNPIPRAAPEDERHPIFEFHSAFSCDWSGTDGVRRHLRPRSLSSWTTRPRPSVRSAQMWTAETTSSTGRAATGASACGRRSKAAGPPHAPFSKTSVGVARVENSGKLKRRARAAELRKNQNPHPRGSLRS